MTPDDTQSFTQHYRLQFGIGGSGKWPLSILMMEKMIAATSLGEAILQARQDACDQATEESWIRACLMDSHDRVRWETRADGLRRHLTVAAADHDRTS